MNSFLNQLKSDDAQIAKQAMEACEAIIGEMGAELHDDLIQRLTVLRFSLDRLENSLTGQPEITPLLLKINSEFQEVVQSVRKTSRKLLPVYMEDNSFQQTIAILCQNLETPGIGTIRFDASGEERKLMPLPSFYLYRMIQELIHNSFKHSSAWNVWVRLLWSHNKIVAEVEDDGSGFSKIKEFTSQLTKKHNTLKMRSLVIQASIDYSAGNKGLLARITYNF